MKAIQVEARLAIFAGTLLAASEAGAIPLPDNSSCSINGSANACLKITNTTTSSTGAAISAVATNNFALRASSTTGAAINASSTSNIALNAASGSSHGISGSTNANRPFAGVYGYNGGPGYGVVGHNYATDGTCTGHTNPPDFSHNGLACAAAVFGDANGNDVSTWAGLFNGDVDIIGSLWMQGVIMNVSDARMKKDVKDAPYGVEEVLKLRPVTFKWKQEDADDRTQIGFLAQEVQKVIPELVSSRGKSDILGLNYTGLIPVLIRALQDQENVSRRQELRLAALEQGGRSTLLSDHLGAFMTGGLLPLGLIGFAVGRRRKDGKRGPAGE